MPYISKEWKTNHKITYQLLCMNNSRVKPKNNVIATIHHQQTVRGISKQDISQTTSWPPATIREPRLLAEYTYRNQKIHVGAVTRHQRRASQTQAGH